METPLISYKHSSSRLVVSGSRAPARTHNIQLQLTLKVSFCLRAADMEGWTLPICTNNRTPGNVPGGCASSERQGTNLSEPRSISTATSIAASAGPRLRLSNPQPSDRYEGKGTY